MGQELTLHQIVEVAGYSFGTVLHLILFRMIQRRRRKQPAEGLFAFLVLACGLWNAGNFVFAFGNALLPGRDLVVLRGVADAVALVGVAAIPSLSLHTLLAQLVIRSGPPRPEQRGLGPVAVGLYAPLVFLPLVLTRVAADPGAGLSATLSRPVGPFPSVVGTFLVWFMAAFLISAGVAFVLASKRRADAPRERTFYLALAGILVGTAGLVLAIYRIGSADLHAAGFTLEVLVILASTVPSLLFAYYIHRHHDVEFLLRRSLFYLLLIVATVLVYLWGISTLSHLLQDWYGLHHQLVEAILIIGLVFLFAPFRRVLQRLFTQVFFRETHTYREVLNELAQSLRRGPVRRLSTLLDQVARTMRKTFSVEDARVIVLDDGDPQAQRWWYRPPRVDALTAWLGRTGLTGVSASDLDEWGDEAAAAEMRELGADVVFAIRYERRLTGLFALGRKRDRSPFYAEELEVCRDLADHIAVTIETHRLYEEKLALERKILETEKLLSLGRFSASVAHRVKNPLSSIKAICQVMREDFEDADARRADLGVVIGEVDRLTEVVNQLLDFANPKGGARGAGDDAGSCDLAAVLEEVAVLFQPEATLYRVRIERPAPASAVGADGERLVVAGNRHDLREVFSNLIQNGIHAMPRGGVLQLAIEHPAPTDAFERAPADDDEEPRAPPEPGADAPAAATDAEAGEAAASSSESAASESGEAVAEPVAASGRLEPIEHDPEPERPAAEAREEVLVTITDTGTGIAPEDRPKIFEPFFTSKPKGTGLGLAIARHKVERVGGRLGVASPAPDCYRVTAAPPEGAGAPGPGTTFGVRLARVPRAAPVAAGEAQASDAEAAPAAAPREEPAPGEPVTAQAADR